MVELKGFSKHENDSLSRVTEVAGIDLYHAMLKKKRFCTSNLSSSARLDVQKQSFLLYLPTQIRFLIVGERVACHWSKLNDAQGKQHLNFGLARNHVVHLETAGNLCTGRPDVKSH